MGKRITIVMLCVLFTLSCQNLFDWETIKGSGNVVREERSVSGINGVCLATSGDLEITLGDKELLFVEAEENLMEHLKCEVTDGVLTIDKKWGINLRPRKRVMFYLTVRELESIVISSSGNIKAPDFKTDRFYIHISSSGDLELGDLILDDDLEARISSSGDIQMGKLRADRLDVHISSSGNLKIAGGEVKEQEINISSSGHYEASNLASERAKVRLSSSGDATLRVSEVLNANTSSSGDIRYFGKPQVSKRSTSSGDVIHLGD